MVLRVGAAGWCYQMHHAASAVGRDFGLAIEYFQTGDGIEGKRRTGGGRLLTRDRDAQEPDAARDRQQGGTHITTKAGEPPEGRRQIPHFQASISGHSLITVLFDESCAELGSRNPKIGTSSHQ